MGLFQQQSNRGSGDRDKRSGSERRSSMSRGEERRAEKKKQLQATFENLLKAIESKEYETIDGKTMGPFLRSLYYYSAGDRTKPIVMPHGPGKAPGHLFPDGMVVRTRDNNIDLSELYGALRIPDDDAVSTILSIGPITEEPEPIVRASLRSNPVMTAPSHQFGHMSQYSHASAPQHLQMQQHPPHPNEPARDFRSNAAPQSGPSGFQQADQPYRHSQHIRFGPPQQQFADSRLTTPAMNYAQPDRSFHNNAAPFNNGGRRPNPGFADD